MRCSEDQWRTPTWSLSSRLVRFTSGLLLAQRFSFRSSSPHIHLTHHGGTSDSEWFYTGLQWLWVIWKPEQNHSESHIECGCSPCGCSPWFKRSRQDPTLWAISGSTRFISGPLPGSDIPCSEIRSRMVVDDSISKSRANLESGV